MVAGSAVRGCRPGTFVGRCVCVALAVRAVSFGCVRDTSPFSRSERPRCRIQIQLRIVVLPVTNEVGEAFR